MSTGNSAIVAKEKSQWEAYLELTKPRVVLLMLLTSYVGMHMASQGALPWMRVVMAMLGIAFSAGSAAVINHLMDQRIDALMGRTQCRPLPTGRITPKRAWAFSLILGLLGMGILVFFVNKLTAILTFISLLGYAVVYTLYLKRATSQNIVIGGLAGAAPPLLGWVAISGHFDSKALLLVLIIFIWTPPHFWALAIDRYEDYKRADIPMLPVTHGIPYTKLSILLYTILLVAVSLLPYAVGMSGVIYLLGALLLGAGFLYYAVQLKMSDNKRFAIKTFRYSIVYLTALFIIMLVAAKS